MTSTCGLPQPQTACALMIGYPGTPDAFTVVSSSLPESLYVVTPVPVMSITAPSSTLPSTSWVGPGISMTYGLGSSRITTPSNTANAPTKWRFGRAAA